MARHNFALILVYVCGGYKLIFDETMDGYKSCDGHVMVT